MSASRHQPIASERRQTSELTTLYAPTASAATRAPYSRAAKRQGRFARIIPSSSRRLPDQHGGDVEEPVSVDGIGRQLSEHVVLPTLARVSTRKLIDQPHERSPQARPQVDRAKRGQREHGQPVRRAELARDRAAAHVQGQVGHDDAEIPVALQ